MSKNQILDSLGRIDDEVIQNVNEARVARKPKLQVRRWAAFAACFALIISMALTAEATNGTVSNLLAPLFGGAQTEIVDKIGVPIGASASVNGYTLTMDAIIGDRYSVMVAYTLSRDDGQPIPENIDFRSRGFSGSGYSTKIIINEDDPSNAQFHLRWRRNDPIIGRIVTATFTDLIIDDGENDVIHAEGTWEIKYTLRYPDSTEELPVKPFEIVDDGGRQFKVEGIMLSPLGIHLDLIFFAPDYEGGVFKDFTMSLVMTDGTEMLLNDGGGGGSWKEGDKKADVDYYAEFDVPIPRDDIKEIIICGVTYELNTSS
ncbi:MAG: DUF4179 domain-containing protein [Oscillospiraceae bacterium]|nr:DUF4179 domain-containing protein [Oscillospiraceae bacterium]